MPSRQLSPESICRLAAELEAAVRAGAPIDMSLGQMARSAPGRLGQVAAALARRVEQGASLSEALEDEAEAIPASFRAVLIAGAHSDDTADVLRDLREMHMKLIDLRNRYRRGMFYPGLVIFVSYGLLLVVMQRFVPELVANWHSLHQPIPGWLQMLAAASATVQIWWPSLLLIAIVLLIAMSRVPLSDGVSLGDRLFGFHRLRRSLSLYQSLLVLELLLEREVPLPRALRFAGEASPVREHQLAWGRVAERVGQGSRLGSALASEHVLPSDVRWLLGVGEVESCLPKTTERLCALYATVGFRQAKWSGAYLPEVTIFVLATFCTLWYGLLVVLPVIELWGAMATE